MKKPFHIQLKNLTSNEEVILKGEFDEQEWSTLVRFASYADELSRAKIFHSGMSLEFSIRWDKESGTSLTYHLPPDDYIAAFLHLMRPFVLKNEPTSFYRVGNILSRRLNHPIMRAAVDRQRQLFLGKDFQSQVLIKSDETVLNADDTVAKWLNAFEYHRDVTKQQELKAMHQVFPLESSRAIFVDMMIDKAKAVFEMARIIRAFENGPGAKIKVKF